MRRPSWSGRWFACARSTRLRRSSRSPSLVGRRRSSCGWSRARGGRRSNRRRPHLDPPAGVPRRRSGRRARKPDTAVSAAMARRRTTRRSESGSPVSRRRRTHGGEPMTPVRRRSTFARPMTPPSSTWSRPGWIPTPPRSASEGRTVTVRGSSPRSTSHRRASWTSGTISTRALEAAVRRPSGPLVGPGRAVRPSVPTMTGMMVAITGVEPAIDGRVPRSSWGCLETAVERDR